jgi:hypothetical protein
MSQIARNLTDAKEGILTGKRYLIHDRDPLFTAEFLKMIADAGVEAVKLPPRSPNLNAHAKRFVRSIKESCLERLIFFGEASLRTPMRNFVAPYHGERNHQGLGNRLISPEPGHVGAGRCLTQNSRTRVRAARNEQAGTTDVIVAGSTFLGQKGMNPLMHCPRASLHGGKSSRTSTLPANTRFLRYSSQNGSPRNQSE